jgi:hypothetical protein
LKSPLGDLGAQLKGVKNTLGLSSLGLGAFFKTLLPLKKTLKIESFLMMLLMPFMGLRVR